MRPVYRLSRLQALLVLFLLVAYAALAVSENTPPPATTGGGVIDLGNPVPVLTLDKDVQASGKIETDNAAPGGTCFRIDFELPGGQERPADGNAVNVDPIKIPAGALPPSPWGLELGLRMDAPQPVHLTLFVRENDGELWRYAIPIPSGNWATQWNRVWILFDWLQIIPWERIDGQFDAGHIASLSFQLQNADTASPRKGSLWLSAPRILSAAQPITAVEQGEFTLLDLGPVYDSDGVAFKTNPMDGDFHTGEWQHRTLPAESFPHDRQAVYRGIPFRMPDVADGLYNHIRCNGQELKSWPERGYSALYFLVTGKFGPQQGDVTLLYTDGTASRVMLEVSDWTVGPTRGDQTALEFPFTYYEDNIEKRKPKLYIQSVRVDPARPLRALKLPYSDYLKVFAATLYAGGNPPKAGVLQDRPRDVVYPRYAMQSLGELTFDKPARSVGVFGGYLQRQVHSYRLSDPVVNGGCTFATDAGKLSEPLPKHVLFWDCFGPDGGGHNLGAMRPAGEATGLLRTDLLDWSCIRYTRDFRQHGDTIPFEVYLSRACPGVLYRTELCELSWEDPKENGVGWLSFESDGGCSSGAIVHRPCTRQLEANSSLSAPDAPWLLLWHTGGGARAFDVPILIVLERKPSAIRITRAAGAGLDLSSEFPQGAGAVAVMPLFGIRQVPYAETGEWAEKGLPDAVVEQCRLWSARLEAFPVGVEETGEVDEAAGTVTIRNRVRYLELRSEWNTRPEPFMMLPPAAALARKNGYTVSVKEELLDGQCNTFYGPAFIARGDSIEYTLPLPRGVTHVLLPSRIMNEAAADSVLKELAAQIREEIPEDAAKARLTGNVSGNLIKVRYFAPAYLQIDPDPRRTEYCREVAESALEDRSLKVEKEPLTGQYYLMDDGFWAKDDSFDKEWEIGYMLQGFWNYAYYCNDAEFLRAHWDRIRGLYRYYGIVFDWATGSTFTMAEGGGANSDGSRIAGEGMLAMARMARMAGDETTWNDACLRSSKQMMSLYATWFAPQWAAGHDYVTVQSRRIRPDKAELRFAPDISWCETHTCNVSHPEEFFQTTHAFYLYNLSNLMFLHDTGLDELRMRSWIYEVVPALHPAWFDGNVMCVADKWYYGSDYAMAHLVVRALLFHEDIRTLYDYYVRCTKDTRVTSEWYRPGTSAPAALSAMVTGTAPLVLAPVAVFRVAANTYDAASLTQHIRLVREKPGQGTLFIRCWAQRVQSVHVGGVEITARYEAKTDYLTIDVPAGPGSELDVAIRYEASASNPANGADRKS
jgi:hypothetical protein